MYESSASLAITGGAFCPGFSFTLGLGAEPIIFFSVHASQKAWSWSCGIGGTPSFHFSRDFASASSFGGGSGYW